MVLDPSLSLRPCTTKRKGKGKESFFQEKESFSPFLYFSKKKGRKREGARAQEREREREKETERERERERPDRESSWPWGREFLSGIIWVTWNL